MIKGSGVDDIGSERMDERERERNRKRKKAKLKRG